MDVWRKRRGGVSRKEKYMCMEEGGNTRPRPLPDFISQPWRKLHVRLRDKIWEWPGDEARYKSERARSDSVTLKYGHLQQTCVGKEGVMGK